MINFIMYSGCIGYKLNFSMYIEQWSKIKCIDLVFVFPQTIYSSSVISWNFGVLLWIQFKVVSWNIALLTETYSVLFCIFSSLKLISRSLMMLLKVMLREMESMRLYTRPMKRSTATHQLIRWIVSGELNQI